MTQLLVKPYITRSAYYAHSENILLAMLAETDKAKRSRAVDTTLQCRQQQSRSNEVRQFVVPSINYSATDYVDMIDWKEVYEPPVTMKLSDEELAKLRDIPLTLHYPNHTQIVERCIKLVSDASKAVYGFDARDGFIRARVNSRSLMPHFDKKHDYAQNFFGQ